MTTYDNATPHPDWKPSVGNLCAGCLGTANLCRVLLDVDDQPCCESCSHQCVRRPLTWDGDQA